MTNHHFHLSSDAIFTHHFLVIEFQKSPKIVYLSQESYTIGRQKDNTIVIASDKISRHHATLLRRSENNNQDYSFWIIDGDLAGNKSQNGIFINRKRKFVHKLVSGDIIHISPDIKATYHIVHHTPEIYVNVSDDPDNVLENQPSINRETLMICDPFVNNLGEKASEQTDILKEKLARLTHEQIFTNYLDYSLMNAKRQESSLGLGLLEIETFESLPVSFKNKILIEITQRLKSTLRKGDFIYYWQEGELMIMIPSLKEIEDLIKLSDRILRIFQQTFRFKEQSFNLKACLGMTVYPEDGIDSKTLIKNTQIALLKVKQNPIISSGFYHPIINKKNIFVNHLDTLIQQGLNQDQFVLYYQPQINLNTQKIEGIEALLRWQHPTLGSLLPHRFLPLAEKGNRIISLGNWVLQTVYQQIIKWQNEGWDLSPISLNLSSQQFYHSHLIQMIDQTLRTTYLDPNLLAIEISEATFIKNLKAASNIMDQLDQRGVSCIIDNFKGSYIPLEQLAKLPIKTLKLDQSLIQNLDNNPQAIKLISAIITLGHHFQINVSATGVENQQQLNILKHLQCHYVQGYLWSPPVTAPNLTRYFAYYQNEEGEMLSVGF